MICFCTIIEFRQIHDFYSQQPICKLFLALSRGLGTDHSKELVLQAVGIGKSGSNLTHECQLASFFLCQLINGFHQQTSGFLEILSESGGQFLLFILPDILHRPVDLPDDMISVRNDYGVFKAYLSNLPKVRIHITNKVFYLLSGFKL